MTSRVQPSSSQPHAGWRQRPTKQQAVKWLYMAHLVLITLAMAVLDFDDPLVLGIGFLVGNALVVFRTYQTSDKNVALAVAVQCVALLSFATMAYMIRKVNQTERYCRLYSKLGEKLEERGAHALGPASRPPLDDESAEPPRQAAGRDITVNLDRARQLGPDFENAVLEPVRSAGEAVAGRSCTQSGFNIKGEPRAREKTRTDYGGDGSRLVDLLRGTVVCEDMDDVLGCFATIDALEQQGTLRVVRVKNRFRDGGVPGSGYRDVNINVEFKNHTCELQLQLRAFYELKKDAHSVYNVVRSLGVGGDLGEIPDSVQLPWGHRLAVTFLMLAASGCALLQGSAYLMISFFRGYTFDRIDDIYPDDQYGAISTAHDLLYALPWSLLLYVSVARLIRALRARSGALALMVQSALAMFFLFFVLGFGLKGRKRSSIISWLFLMLMLLFLRDIFETCRRIAWNNVEGVRRPSRIGLLFDRHFGLHGTHFAYRVMAQQLCMVALQAWTKLPGIGAIAICPISDHTVLPLFWAVLVALVINAAYPILLLRSSDPTLQRYVPSFLDAAVDFVYGPVTFFVVYEGTGGWFVGDQYNLLGYFSLFAPTFHLFAVACGMELAALQRARARKEEEEAAAGHRASLTQRMDGWHAPTKMSLMWFAVTTFLVIGAAYHDVYPVERVKKLTPSCALIGMEAHGWFEFQNITNDDAILIANALAQKRPNGEELFLSRNRIADKGAIAVANALAQNDVLWSLDLSHNQITDEGAIALANALAQIDALRFLYLSHNQITDEGAIALASALAHNVTNLNLDLSGNLITPKCCQELLSNGRFYKEKQSYYYDLKFKDSRLLCVR